MKDMAEAAMCIIHIAALVAESLAKDTALSKLGRVNIN